MSLLSEIQGSLLKEGASLELTLLKLRFLASRMGSHVLEDWVRHEVEGYPGNITVPEYRRTGIIFSGTLTDGHTILNDVPIPLAIIEQYAGKHGVTREFREGMAEIESAITRAQKETKVEIDASNLQLLIQDKIYKGMICVSLRGIINLGVFIRIQSSVRAKILELTINLEKTVPAIKDISFGEKTDVLPAPAVAAANSATQSIVYNISAPVTQIVTSGSVERISLEIAQGDINNLISELSRAGIPKKEAHELAEIVADEKPSEQTGTLGERTRRWLGDKISGASGLAWGMTREVITDILTEAVKKYYGL
jgi:DNA-binding transcriptional regulator YhcF (GntR family)